MLLLTLKHFFKLKWKELKNFCVEHRDWLLIIVAFVVPGQLLARNIEILHAPLDAPIVVGLAKAGWIATTAYAVALSIFFWFFIGMLIALGLAVYGIVKGIYEEIRYRTFIGLIRFIVNGVKNYIIHHRNGILFFFGAPVVGWLVTIQLLGWTGWINSKMPKWAQYCGMLIESWVLGVVILLIALIVWGISCEITEFLRNNWKEAKRLAENEKQI